MSSTATGAVFQTTHETAQCNKQSLNYKLSKNTTRAIQVETCHSLIWNSLQALDASQVSLESWKLWCFHKAKINIDKDMYIHISQLINLYEGCMEWWRHGANLCTHQNCASFQTLVMSQFIIDESGGGGVGRRVRATIRCFYRGTSILAHLIIWGYG